MTFKLIEKGTHLVNRVEEDQISVSKTSVSFGEDTVKFFGSKEFVEMYLDPPKKLVGFKPTDDEVKGFKVNHQKNDSLRVTGAWIKRLPTGRYKVNFDIDPEKAVIEVPEILETLTTEKVKEDE